jgi:hypothetical protein
VALNAGIVVAGAGRDAGWRFGNDLIAAVAISAAESSWIPAIANSDFSQLSGAALTAARNYNCNGRFAIGLWQIFIPVHRARVRTMSGIDGACAQDAWLQTARNNARVAYAIWQDSGWDAWSAFTAGTYLQFWGISTQAVNQLLGLPHEGVPPKVPIDHLAAVQLDPLD